MTRRKFLTHALLALGLAGAVAPASADVYPDKPVKLVIPFSAGGVTDVLGRLFADKLRVILGAPVVVENKTGGGTTIGSEYVAQSPPDGYTLYLAASSLATAPSMFPNVKYDPVKDFAPITLAAGVVHVLVINPKKFPVEIDSVADLIAYLKANPGKVSYASSGNGVSNHLEMELFKSQAKVFMTHIPYRGSAPAVMDLISDAVDVAVMFDPWATVGAHVKSGKLKALAVPSAKRAQMLPELPTIAESGLPGFEAMPWLGLLAPAGTPRPIVDQLHQAMVQISKDPDVLERYRSSGLDMIMNTPDEFAAFIKSDVLKWSKIIQESGAKVD